MAVLMLEMKVFCEADVRLVLMSFSFPHMRGIHKFWLPEETGGCPSANNPVPTGGVHSWLPVMGV
jgi:hypothetical protein